MLMRVAPRRMRQHSPAHRRESKHPEGANPSMARLFGLIGNRTDLAGRILASESSVLSVRAAQGGEPLGWGIGFHQGGEVLMRRRPIDERPVLDLGALAGDVRAD